MNTSYALSGLYRYSVKSGAAETLESATIGPQGLEGDRRFMLVDEADKFITARRYPQLLSLQIGLNQGQLTLSLGKETPASFALDSAPQLISVQVWNRTILTPHLSAAADQYLSDNLQIPVKLVQLTDASLDQAEKRYPWGPIFSDGYPLLVTNTASLDALNSATCGNFEMERFRPNLVIEGTQPWEEHQWRYLKIGKVLLKAEKPCERCVLITRDPITGEKDPGQQPLRALGELNKRGAGAICFGENLSVVTPGIVQVGDQVLMLNQPE